MRVESFSKINAMFFPVRRGCSVPVYFAFFKSAERSSRYLISCGVKSSSFKKFLFFKLKAMFVVFRICLQI